MIHFVLKILTLSVCLMERELLISSQGDYIIVLYCGIFVGSFETFSLAVKRLKSFVKNTDLVRTKVSWKLVN